jgi:hypothetical protein
MVRELCSVLVHVKTGWVVLERIHLAQAMNQCLAIVL